MRRKIVTVWMCAMMIASAFVMVADVGGKEIADSTQSTPVFLDVYTSPRYPLGANRTTGLGGDIITVYANVTNVLNDDVWVTWFFTNNERCSPASYDVMTHVSGTLYKYVLPGDSYKGWNVFGESYTIFEHIGIQLVADPTDGIGDYTTYPAQGDWHYIFPAIQPKQINATSYVSKTTMLPGETFWVNGTSNYWDSTAYPGDYSQLFPADECPVTIKVGPNTFNSKTDINGNYAVQVTAPVNTGFYYVNTTVSNATANRNVPCLCSETQIEVVGTGLTPHAPIRIDGDYYFTCPDCSGAGNWDCPDCVGGFVICSICGGSGSTDCPDCDGGVASCAVCSGSGLCPDCDNPGDGNCPDCHGVGEINCPDCIGTGLCSWCGGDGDDGGGPGSCAMCMGTGQCPSCAGDGWIECLNCGGTGDCPICYGSGVCTICSGQGTWPCTNPGCTGGDIVCSACAGFGGWACPTCVGPGFITCPTCGGTGQILVEGTDFSDYGFSGEGSETNPWIIEGWDIDGTGYGYCIYIGNTTDYFVVRNCYLHEASGVGSDPYYPNSGLILYNVENGIIVNNTVSSNFNVGIYLSSSSDNVIYHNNIVNNGYGAYQQITDNAFDDTSPQTYNGQNTWSGYDETDREIFFWNGTSTIQLTDNAYNDYDPMIFNGQITWYGYDGSDYEIFFWDGMSTIQLTNNAYNDYRPQIYDGQITWQGNFDGGNYEILFWDGTSTIQLTNNSYYDRYPEIYNGQITWQCYDGSDFEIMLWNGTSTAQLTDNTYDDYYPQIYDGQITWHGYDGNDNETFFWDGISTIQLTDNAYDDYDPEIYDGQITWQGFNGGYYKIFFWDGTTTIQLSENSYDNWYPQINNGQVVWYGLDGSDNEIFFWDGTTTIPLTDNTYDDSNPQIRGGQITWEHYDGSDLEIFAATPLQTYDDGTNIWDNGYPSGGNYWSDYNGTDGNGDGIGDTPYLFDFSQDNYPLMEPWSDEPQQATHLPIRINSNADFTPANGVSGGEGSAGNPWVIEGWDIDGTGYGYCIYVGNTTDYFVVRDCYLHGASGFSNWPSFKPEALTLYNAQNGHVTNINLTGSLETGLEVYQNDANWGNYTDLWDIFANWDGGNPFFTRAVNLSGASSFDVEIWGELDSNDLDMAIFLDGLNGNPVDGITQAGEGVQYSATATANERVTLLNPSDGTYLIRVFGFALSANPGHFRMLINLGCSGISLYSAANNVVSNNIVRSNYNGINLNMSNFNTISANIVSSNINGINLEPSNQNNLGGNVVTDNFQGIRLLYSNSNDIACNTVSMNQYGIYSDSSSNTFINNIASQNSNTGIYLFNSNNNTIDDSYSQNNLNGITLEKSEDNMITDTIVSSNSAEGIKVSSNYNKITRCSILSNGNNGCLIEGSNNEISHSTISNNQYGINIQGAFNNLFGNEISENSFGIYSAMDKGFFYLAYNMRKTSFGYLDNDPLQGDYGKPLRQAVAHCIDKAYIVDTLLNGAGYPGDGPVSPTLPEWKNNSLPQYSFDILQAKSILSAAGWLDYDSDGWLERPDRAEIGSSSGGAIEILMPTYEYDPIRAEAGDMIAAQLQIVGINAMAVHLDFGSIIDRMNQRNFDMYILGWQIGSDPTDFLNAFFHSSMADSGQNYPGYRNSMFDALIEQARATSDMNEKYQLVKDCQGILSDDLPYDVLYFRGPTENTIIENNISSNENGIYLVGVNNHTIYHNNIIGNVNQSYDSGANLWDDGYPSGGNYWSDYAGMDLFNGPSQNIPGNDGIGDTPYGNVNSSFPVSIINEQVFGPAVGGEINVGSLDHVPVLDATVFKSNYGTWTLLIEATDYTLNYVTGAIIMVNQLNAGDCIYVAYDYFVPYMSEIVFGPATGGETGLIGSLVNTPVINATLYKANGAANGILMTQGVDYTMNLETGAITLLIELSAGDHLWAYYNYSEYFPNELVFGPTVGGETGLIGFLTNIPIVDICNTVYLENSGVWAFLSTPADYTLNLATGALTLNIVLTAGDCIYAHYNGTVAVWNETVFAGPAIGGETGLIGYLTNTPILDAAIYMEDGGIYTFLATPWDYTLDLGTGALTLNIVLENGDNIIAYYNQSVAVANETVFAGPAMGGETGLIGNLNNIPIDNAQIWKNNGATWTMLVSPFDYTLNMATGALTLNIVLVAGDNIYANYNSTILITNTVLDNYPLMEPWTPTNIYSIPWFDDMESGQNDWTTETFNNNTRWELGNPSGWGPGTAYSGSNCWGTNIDSYYWYGAETYLYTPIFDAPSYDIISFQMWFQSYSWFDAGWVEVSSNGNNWTRIEPTAGPSYSNTTWGRGYSGIISIVNGTWQYSEFDISSFPGGTLQVRFCFRSEWWWGGYPGWYIDDFYIGTPPDYRVQLTPDTQTASGTIGQMVASWLTVENTGLQDDVYNLNISGNSWETRIYDVSGMFEISDIYVPADSSANIWVRVWVPWGALAGEQSTAKIMAWSLSGVSDSSTVVTRVGAVQNLNTGTWYPTIQEAVNYANTGDTLWARNGTYYENVTINKPLALIGENRDITIIDGGGNGHVVCVQSSEVSISGFTIRNSGSNWEDSGIRLNWGVQNCRIEDNIITSNRYGIRLDDSDGNTIANNTVSNNDYGLYLYSSSGNIIANNTISSNNDCGIYLGRSGNNTVVGNTISYGYYGIYLYYNSQNNTISNNVIRYNNYGIRFEGERCNSNTITQCNILNNYYGVYFYSWGYSHVLNQITYNNILSNEYMGIYMQWNTQYNNIHHNNIADNSWQNAYADSGLNVWDDGYPSGGNYWGDYSGNDFYSGPLQNIPGFDGIGDTPYYVNGDGSNSSAVQDHYPFLKAIPGCGPQLITDSAPPQHSNESPGPGSRTNDATPTISVRVFDNSWVNESTLKLYINGYSVKTLKTLKSDGQNVYFDVSYTHNSGFTDGQVVTCRIVARDIHGNFMEYSWQFTVDLAAPYVVSVSPLHSAIDVPRNTTINVTFSEPMDHASTEAAFSINPEVSGYFTWAGNAMTFHPNTNLAPVTLYVLSMDRDAMDLAGNHLAPDCLWSFTTEQGGIRIYHGPVSDVELGISLVVDCDVAAYWGSSVVNCTLYYIPVGESEYTSIPMTLIFGNAVFGTWRGIIPAQFTIGTLQYYIEAQNDWFESATYPETDPVTNPVLVSIIDTTSPLHSGEQPQQNSTVYETVPIISVNVTDLLAIDTSTISLFVNGFEVDYTLELISGGYRVSYLHEELLPNSWTYCRVVAEDVFGNRLDWNWSFIFVVDITPPSVITTNPSNGAHGVATDTAIWVTFNEPVQHWYTELTLSITPTIPVTYTWVNNTLYVIPLSALAINTDYILSLAAVDLYDNYMPVMYSWSFDTDDMSPPTHANETPPDGGQSCNLISVISVEVTDVSGISPGTVKLYFNGFQVAHSAAVIVGGYLVSYWHESGFIDGQFVTCRIVASDMLGNTLDYTWHFTANASDSFEFQLSAGWNLISIPLVQTNTSILNVLSSIAGHWDVAKYYDASDVSDPWKTYRVGSSVNDLWNIDNTMGFWLHATSNTSLIIYGQLPSNTNIALKAGWNLVGYPSLNGTRTIADALFGTGYTRVEGFDAVSPYVRVLNGSYIMLPGEGYWVYVPADTVWTVFFSMPPSDDTINAEGGSSGSKGSGDTFSPQIEQITLPVPSDIINGDIPTGNNVRVSRVTSGGLTLFALMLLMGMTYLAIRRRRK